MMFARSVPQNFVGKWLCFQGLFSVDRSVRWPVMTDGLCMPGCHDMPCRLSLMLDNFVYGFGLENEVKIVFIFNLKVI